MAPGVTQQPYSYTVSDKSNFPQNDIGSYSDFCRAKQDYPEGLEYHHRPYLVPRSQDIVALFRSRYRRWSYWEPLALSSLRSTSHISCLPWGVGDFGILGTWRSSVLVRLFFHKLGVLFMGALIMRTLLFGVYIGALDFRKLPSLAPELWQHPTGEV